MGNTGSHTGQINNTRSSAEDQWTQSFPRTQPTRFQHRVLPEQGSRQRLRHTDNGEILQQGGTLSGRHQSQLRHSVDNLSSTQDAEFGGEPSARSYLPAQRLSFHKTGFGSSHYLHHKQNASNQKALKEQMKLFGSEPDLRFSTQLVSPDQEMKERRNRKKYKAPPPPTNRPPEKQATDWEENSSDDYPIRRTRLFKTRAEMKKQASHVNRFENNLEKYEDKTTTVQINSQHHQINNSTRPNRLSLPEMRIAETEEFQRELKEATRRLRSSRIEDSSFDLHLEKYSGDKEKLKTLDPNKDLIKRKFKQIIEIEENNNQTNSNSLSSPRGEPSGKESTTPEHSPIMEPKDQSNSKPKAFYFGMEENDMHVPIVPLTRVKHIAHSSESDISTDIDPDDANDTASTGIDLRLRPILPKKQLEIPRFSPAIAWKLLSAIENENNTNGTIRSDDISVMIEDKIEKYARPPPPNIQCGRRSHDKSGDSGISGDAGVGFEELDQNIKTTQYERKTGMSWVPQQDLEEDDSSLEELNLKISAQKSRRNLLNRPHVFSLSLPRDNHLAAYMTEKVDYHSSGFQKLKRSVSGVFGNLSHRKDLTQSNSNQEDGANWFFSKSAPNSLNNGFNSLDTRNTHEETELNFTAGKSHHRSSTNRLMYLPECGRKSPEPRAFDYQENRKSKLSVYSKSCEELNAKNKVPETLQDPPKSYENEWKFPTKKPKKFTFQSTVRQIERRRMAEKLSKEAEKKEKQRLRELEAMQRVEEEFQRKRAKEKASIRQQLRLYAMDDTQWTNRSPNLECKSEERQEPDGALSSSTSSSPPPPQMKSHKNDKLDLKYIAPVTQELSEYRQVQRDYKDYRGNFKYSSDSRYPKQTTVHPKVTCNMPKAKGSNLGNGNYRKDFAYGVKSNKSLDSTHSEDSVSNSPKMYHNKYTPITRF